MAPEDLLNVLRLRPFVPFRLRLKQGQTYEVPCPADVMVLRRMIVVGDYDQPTNPDVILAHAELVALDRVASLEFQE